MLRIYKEEARVDWRRLTQGLLAVKMVGTHMMFFGRGSDRFRSIGISGNLFRLSGAKIKTH
ncbi:hypothetical protein Leryth_023918 [Lithospermum erythrorhizon]|nr:hypothetical protein Leryth_023918 [Lithospermum erythrorhizon]